MQVLSNVFVLALTGASFHQKREATPEASPDAAPDAEAHADAHYGYYGYGGHGH